MHVRLKLVERSPKCGRNCSLFEPNRNSVGPSRRMQPQVDRKRPKLGGDNPKIAPNTQNLSKSNPRLVDRGLSFAEASSKLVDTDPELAKASLNLGEPGTKMLAASANLADTGPMLVEHNSSLSRSRIHKMAEQNQMLIQPCLNSAGASPKLIERCPQDVDCGGELAGARPTLVEPAQIIVEDNPVQVEPTPDLDAPSALDPAAPDTSPLRIPRDPRPRQKGPRYMSLPAPPPPPVSPHGLHHKPNALSPPAQRRARAENTRTPRSRHPTGAAH